EVVEQGVRVSLGPDAHAARATERAVVRVNSLRAVPVHLHMIPLEVDAQLMPDARCDLAAPISELDSASVLHVVEADVVFECIRAAEVVVVLILVAEHDAARAVDVPRHGLALHGNAAVSAARRPGGRYREPVVGTVAVDLGQNVRRTGRV